MQYSILHYSIKSSAQLPQGYEVKKQGFQKHAVYFQGQLLGVFQFQGHAVNKAIRHSRGSKI